MGGKIIIPSRIERKVDNIESKLLNPDERYNVLDKANTPLDVLKQYKLEQLNYLCTETILGRFKAIVDGVIYEFSYDYEAQLRFLGTKALLSDGTITEIEWTAYLNGERVRIVLTASNFANVQLPALNHQNNNVIKYNELFQQVTNATTNEEVDAVVW